MSRIFQPKTALIFLLAIAMRPQTQRVLAAEPSPAPVPTSDSRLLRDPFKMIQTDAIDTRERTDLESVSIDDVRIVGILTGPTRTRAIAKIMTNGKTFVVGEGMRIGTDDEVIDKITSHGIVLVGSRVNTIGERESLTTELPLVLEDKKMDVKSNTMVKDAPSAASIPAPAVSGQPGLQSQSNSSNLNQNTGLSPAQSLLPPPGDDRRSQ